METREKRALEALEPSPGRTPRPKARGSVGYRRHMRAGKPSRGKDALHSPGSPAPDPILAAAPVGPRVETAHGDWGLATATFSNDRRYRFRLSRVWDPSGGRVLFIMLNPSTADALVLDPTVRRCARFAKAWGAGALEVTNCFALRSTDPAGLRQVDDPVGDGNDEAIVTAALAADEVVVAWGVRARYLGREQQVAALLEKAGVGVACLRRTRRGHPGHPLYLPSDSVPTAWPD